jgi:uncharacterized membrane protein HdeD (DUF308 family)
MGTTVGGGFRTRPHLRWGWFVALGVIQILLGIFAWFYVVLVTLAGVILLGAALVVGGFLQIIHAFMTRDWGAFLLHLLAGVLYVIGGLLLMAEPVSGSLALTVLVAAALIAAGVMRIVIGLGHRDLGGWWLVLLGGAVCAAVGVLLVLALPWSGLWVVGTLIAIELLVHGFSSIQFGLDLRRWGQLLA